MKRRREGQLTQYAYFTDLALGPQKSVDKKDLVHLSFHSMMFPLAYTNLQVDAGSGPGVWAGSDAANTAAREVGRPEATCDAGLMAHMEL